jgi:hypothetical protein
MEIVKIALLCIAIVLFIVQDKQIKKIHKQICIERFDRLRINQ